MDFYLFLGTLAATIFTLLGSIFYMVYGKIRVHENKIIASPPSSSWPLSLPSSSWSRSWEYDVFPSFHGPDVRKQFLSHILKEFESKGISFFNDNKIQRGESIAPELKRAIKESKIAVVLLSKNYASSSWCLDELVEIMNIVLGQTVLTIFYEVDPTDVRSRPEILEKSSKRLVEVKPRRRLRHGEKLWRVWPQSQVTIQETGLIENIAADISKMLNHLAPSPDLDCLIGMGTHMESMKLLLRLDLDEVRMIGIWGPPGIGKSTIARYMFNQLSNSFRFKAILVNINGSYPRPCLDEGNEQLQLQSKMLSQMINHKDIVITHLGVAQERLKDKKVLLVLDDVDRVAQLDALAKKFQWFGPGSRIIITTENSKLLKAHGINDIYKVEFPTNDEALEMFCMYAFDQKSPKDGFTKLSRRIAYLAGKLPLGLKVMGSYLRGMTKQEWKRVLPKLWSQLDGEIETVLQFSYDALCDEDKYLFLHIACLLNHEHIKKVEEHLVNKFFLDVRQRLDVLAEKSLISFNRDRIEMHSLLVQLGKEIVRKQHREPGQRQFLVDDKDICELLTDPTAITRSVIGIYSRDTLICHSLNANERALEGMSNLQFLRFRTHYKNPNMASLSGCLKYISPKLQLLDWECSPMTCLPFIVNLEFLVELNMPESKLEKLWEGIKVLRNLKRINLSFSKNLKELPDFSTATNLQDLYLFRCWNLVELPSLLGNATSLQNLILGGRCSSLVELPSFIGNATNLQVLHLSYCSNLVVLPWSIGNATSLQELDLSHCSSLVELPPSIGNAANLQDLDLSHCSSLVELPSSLGNAANLQILDLSYCSSLMELPFLIGNATSLQDLNLRCCCSLVEFPSSLGNLHRLTRFNLEECSKLEVLPTNINLESLKELSLTYCWSLKSFPEISTNIEYLKLNGTAIEEVPTSIRWWSRLTELHMVYSENLKESPHAFDRITELHLNDTRIQELSPWVKGCSRLRRLVLNGMENLVSLPQLPDSLEVLDAENCKSLERLDCTFRNLDIHLNFRNCFKLNEKARDVIIQASTTHELSVLPGGEVPACFTYRAPGSSVTVELNEKPLRTSTKFKACILFVDKGKEEFHDWPRYGAYCTITSKQNAHTRCSYNSRRLYPYVTKHLYIFDVEAEDVTSTELVFEFKVGGKTDTVPCKIKECGVLQL